MDWLHFGYGRQILSGFPVLPLAESTVAGFGLPTYVFCVPGFHRNEDMKAIDVLPILKEKVAFLSGQTFIMTVFQCIFVFNLYF